MLDLERGKRDLEQSILRKDTEIHQMMTQLDDEQSGMNRIQKSIKELQVSLFKTVSYDTCFIVRTEREPEPHFVSHVTRTG